MNWEEYAKQKCEDPLIAHILPYWIKLSESQYMIRENESLLESIATLPWEHSNPKVIQAWEELTKPENYNALTRWSDETQKNINQNSKAMIYTQKAIENCQKRRNKNS